MELEYATNKIKAQCKSIKAANKLFNGDAVLSKSLLARINALEKADTLKDIVVQPTFHFHNLTNKNGRDLSGYFAIDVKSRREPWRVILQPLDDNKNPFDQCHIDKIASYVKIVKIEEVSKHYE